MATTDGAPGALKAITTTWPTTRIQRCLTHVRHDTVRDLTLRPRTTHGRALLGLSRKLLTITTTDQAATWTTALNSHATEYRTWLNPRTTAQDDPATAALTGKKWWHTHPRTRRAYKRHAPQSYSPTSPATTPPWNAPQPPSRLTSGRTPTRTSGPAPQVRDRRSRRTGPSPMLAIRLG